MPADAEEVVEAAVVRDLKETRPIAAAPATPVPASHPPRPGINWELLIGRKGLGWVAVVLLLFGTAFFLRYAYDNKWIGPQGQVAIGEALGLCLAVAGAAPPR